MGKIIFPCGCSFTTLDRPENEVLHAEQLRGSELPRIDVDIYNIGHDCPATWELFCRGDTKGVFQLEGHLGKTWAKKVHPETLEDLGALVALLRPGCLKAMSGDPPKSMTQRFVDRKHRLEDVTYYNEALRPILEKTYGVLVYQEQAMKISVVLAGFNEQEADVLRKAIGKKKPEIMAKIKDEFVGGCLKLSIVDEEQAREIFGWIQESQRYSFNKSHAVCYGEDAWWTAFCKTHFPTQFYCSWLDGAHSKPEPMDEIYELVNDAKINNVEIKTPDLRDVEFIPYIKGEAVYFGLGDIKNIGAAAVKRIKSAINKVHKPVVDWEWKDYLFQFAPNATAPIIESLIAAGALDYLSVPRTRMLYEFKLWSQLTDKEQDWVIKGLPWDSLLDALQACCKVGGGCHNERRRAIVGGMVKMLTNPPHELTDAADFIAWNEETYLGAPITCNKVDACDEAIHSNTTCREVREGKKGYMVLAVEIVRVKEITTKKGKTPGQRMAFLSVCDSSCSLDEVVAFPDIWKEESGRLYPGNTVLLQVERSKLNSLIVKKVSQI